MMISCRLGHLLMVSLNHLSHRKCISFDDRHVDFFCYRTCTLLHGARKFQEQLNYEIFKILIANSDYLVSDCWIDGA